MISRDPTPHQNREVDRGRLLVFLSAVLWSLAGVFIKFLDLHPLTIVCYRCFFASLVFVPFLRRSRWALSGPVVISVISYSAAITAFVSATKLTTAANAIVLQYTAPIFVFLYSRLVLGERIAAPHGIALAISMAGIGIVSLDHAGRPEMAGVLLALCSGVFLAIYMVNLQRASAVNPVTLTWLNNFVCALILLPFVKAPLAVSTEQVWLLLVMGAVQLGLPYFLFAKGLRTVALQEAALIALIEPVLNPLWVALVVGELPSRSTIAGGSLIVLGLGARYLLPLLGGSSRAVPLKS